MKPELRITLQAMLEELEENQLVVEVAPAPSPRHCMHGVRVAVSKNANWYRHFCAQFPSSRRDQNRKGRTAIRRRNTRIALEAMIEGRCAGQVYPERLLAAARAYWRRHSADLRGRLAAEMQDALQEAA